MVISHLPGFSVRRLYPEDAGAIFDLCAGNPLFYRYHPPFVTRDSILEDMRALPPGKTYEDKYFLGFFQEGRLAAVMDLILAYPDDVTAFIGFFMVDAALQGRGTGSSIIAGCTSLLSAAGFHRLRLAVDRDNPQSGAFWRKCGLTPSGNRGDYVIMEREI